MPHKRRGVMVVPVRRMRAENIRRYFLTRLRSRSPVNRRMAAAPKFRELAGGTNRPAPLQTNVGANSRVIRRFGFDADELSFQFMLGFEIELLVSALRLPCFFPQFVSQTLNFFF